MHHSNVLKSLLGYYLASLQFWIHSSPEYWLSVLVLSSVCLPVCQSHKNNAVLFLSLICSSAGSFRYSCDICGKKYKYYSCFQEHRDLHAVDGNHVTMFLEYLHDNSYFSFSFTLLRLKPENPSQRNFAFLLSPHCRIPSSCNSNTNWVAC